MATMTYSFDETASQRAHEEWGANCGPNALAFALQLDINDVRSHIPDFDRKRYTSPTMMKEALKSLGVTWFNCKADKEYICWPEVSLVRVQWTGPWTAPGSNPKWAYGHTHWIATWIQESANHPFCDSMVFDCNGGIMTLNDWVANIVPELTKYPRADGGWQPTHVWRIDMSNR